MDVPSFEKFFIEKSAELDKEEDAVGIDSFSFAGSGYYSNYNFLFDEDKEAEQNKNIKKTAEKKNTVKKVIKKKTIKGTKKVRTVKKAVKPDVTVDYLFGSGSFVPDEGSGDYFGSYLKQEAVLENEREVYGQTEGIPAENIVESIGYRWSLDQQNKQTEAAVINETMTKYASGGGGRANAVELEKDGFNTAGNVGGGGFAMNRSDGENKLSAIDVAKSDVGDPDNIFVNKNDINDGSIDFIGEGDIDSISFYNQKSSIVTEKERSVIDKLQGRNKENVVQAQNKVLDKQNETKSSVDRFSRLKQIVK